MRSITYYYENMCIWYKKGLNFANIKMLDIFQQYGIGNLLEN